MSSSNENAKPLTDGLANPQASENAKPRIVVVGGGFAGLNFVKRIDKRRYDVMLIDYHNYHQFPPLFYQVASSGLDPASICFPFRREMRKRKAKGVKFNLGKVKEIDLKAKKITTQLETLDYDILVLAAGTTNNFFGNPDLEKIVYTIKSTSQSIRCRNDILERLEQAAVAKEDERRKKLLNFVVVGGGPTGVEIAGAIGEMKRYILRREYPSLQLDDMHITLIEGADRLLRTMTERSSADAAKYLEALMVDVRTGVVLKDYDGERLTLSDGSTMDAGMVIWTAGVVAESFTCTSGQLPVARGGRISVNECNRVNGLKNVYALGDICLMTSDKAFPDGHPQLAQVAIQQARLLADNLNRGTHKHFRYKDKGSMATIGRNRAVVDLKHVHVHGFMAWLTWMFVHLVTLLGMRNKVAVLVNWLWAYFSYTTSLRLLIHPARYPIRRRWGEKL